MSSNYTGVVVGVDASSTSEATVRLAAEEAVRHRQPLHLLHVLQFPVATGPVPFTVNIEAMAEGSRATLADLASQQRLLHPELEITTRVVIGSPVAELIEASRTARMVVVGCRGRGGFAALVLGSVSAQLAEHAHGPVVVVRPVDGDPQSRLTLPVLVGVDGSATSQAAVGFAFAEADARGVALIAQLVWWAPSYEGLNTVDPWFDEEEVKQESARALAEGLAGWCEKFPDVTVENRLIQGVVPEAELVDASDHAGLVVVGSRGRGGFAGLLLGSVGQALIHHAACPVAIVHPTVADARP